MGLLLIYLQGFLRPHQLNKLSALRFLFLKNQKLTVALVLGRQPKLIATMKKLFFIFIGTVLAISADATELISATSIQTCVISKLDAQQQFFSVTGYYYQNR